MLVEVWQDSVCPWCRIGERHLDLALAEWTTTHADEPVEVRYRAFFLDPTMPPEGREFRTAMQAKGGGRVPLEDFFAEPRRRGAQVGLTFNFEAITRMPNTLLSHRLVKLAPPERQGALLEAVYAAFFERGEDIGQLDVLVSLAAAAGLDGAAVRQALQGDAGRADALADVAEARDLGISGVPFFVFDRRFAVSGAQPSELLRGALDRALTAR